MDSISWLHYRLVIDWPRRLQCKLKTQTYYSRLLGLIFSWESVSFLRLNQAQSVAFISAGWFNDLDPLLCHYAQCWGSTRNTCWTIIIVSSPVPLGRTFYSLCHDRGQTFVGSVLFVQCAFLVALCEGGVCYPKASTRTGVLMQCLRPSLTLSDKQIIGVLRMAGLKSSRCTVWRGVG